MANVKSFPNNQDVYIGAEDVMKWLYGRTSGVFGSEDNATVSAVLNEMAVTVSDGIGWMAGAAHDGIVWWNDSEATSAAKLKLAIDAADATLNRIDRIIVEWKTTNYVDLPEIKVLTGSPASNAVAPALTNNSTVRQISLARVYVAAGTTAITASMVTDERLDASVCGIVTESIHVDTSTMQNQFEALLESIRNELKELNAGTACLLKTGDTMQGTLDMGGNAIKNVAAPTEDADAVPKSYVDEALSSFDGGTAMTLLWENADTNSTFATQSIGLDLRSYRRVLIEYIFSPDYYNHYTVLVRLSDMTESVHCTVPMFIVSTANKTGYRPVYGYYKTTSSIYGGTDMANGYIHFEDAKYNDATNNKYAIPTKIWGIKGAIE